MVVIKKLLSTHYMVKEDIRQGEIPRSRDAYGASLRIALPAIMEMVSLSLMGMLDTVMVGRLDSEGVAVSAVGLTNQPRMIFLSVFFAINTAVTAIAARNKGAGDMKAVRSCLRSALMLTVLLGVLAAAAMVALAEPMMLFAGAKSDTVDPAAAYFRIIGFALFFQVLTMTICAAQRACGNTKITMKVNVIAGVINLTLNFLLIEGRFGFPRLEVEGAALATVISSAVSFTLAAVTVFQKDSPLRITVKEDELFDKQMFKNITKIASGGIVEQVGMRFGFFIYALVVANLGTKEFAAHIIAMQLMHLSFTFADGIGIATSSLVGQNLGKKRPDLSIMYGKIGLRLALATAAVLSLTCVCIRHYFPLLFTDSQEIAEITAGVILIIAATMPVQTMQLVMGGSLRGAADTRFVALTMVITVGIIRPLGGYLLTYPLGFGIVGAWAAMFIDQVVRLIMLLTRFMRGKWIRIEI